MFFLGLYNLGLYNWCNSYLGSRDLVNEKVTEFSVTSLTFGIPGFALTEKIFKNYSLGLLVRGLTVRGPLTITLKMRWQGHTNFSSVTNVLNLRMEQSGDLWYSLGNRK